MSAERRSFSPPFAPLARCRVLIARFPPGHCATKETVNPVFSTHMPSLPLRSVLSADCWLRGFLSGADEHCPDRRLPPFAWQLLNGIGDLFQVIARLKRRSTQSTLPMPHLFSHGMVPRRLQVIPACASLGLVEEPFPIALTNPVRNGLLQIIPAVERHTRPSWRSGKQKKSPGFCFGAVETSLLCFHRWPRALPFL